MKYITKQFVKGDKRLIAKSIALGCFWLLSFGFHSCVDAMPEGVLDYDDHYTSSGDADMATLGLYGQVMELAGQVVVLNELKADLMDVTDNATTDLEEINLNISSKDNEWTNVTKFYAVIQNCNDILYNFTKMKDENKMIEAEFNERYSDVMAVRCWVYLQLGLIFGEVPYITEPIISLEDVKSHADKTMNLDQLIPELIRCMEGLPTLNAYESSNLIQTIDGYSLGRYFINKRFLIGDLYLYNDQYEKAAAMYYNILQAGANSSNRTLTLYNYPWTAGTPTWFAIMYRDKKGDDSGSLYNGWSEMFSLGTTDRYVSDELLWFMTYDMKFAPSYPFPELFFPPGIGMNKGKYYLKPSEYAVEEVWGSEIQNNGFPFDARGLTGAFDKKGNDTYIKKFGNDSTKQNWILYRAGLLHLRYAEAVNRSGYSKLAYALLNNGIHGGAYNYRREDGTDYPGDSVRQTGNSPFDLHKAPYSFDARQSDIPYIRAPWRDNSGVRGRAALPNIAFPFIDDIRNYKEPNTENQEAIHYMEKMIIREAALEMGFEGNRWGDLVRIARRMNKENPGSGDAFLWDENIAKKHQKAGTAADMSSKDKWFLKLYY